MCNPANKHGPPRRVAAHRHKPARRRRAYASDGNILTKHHEGTNPLTMSYDAANRLTTSILGTTQLTTYTYSNAGEMAGERCDSLGIRATFVYDGEHRCVNEIRATTHSYTYAFDGLRRSAHMAGTANAVSFVWDGTDLLNEYVPGGLSGTFGPSTTGGGCASPGAAWDSRGAMRSRRLRRKSATFVSACAWPARVVNGASSRFERALTGRPTCCGAQASGQTSNENQSGRLLQRRRPRTTDPNTVIPGHASVTSQGEVW